MSFASRTAAAFEAVRRLGYWNARSGWKRYLTVRQNGPIYCSRSHTVALSWDDLYWQLVGAGVIARDDESGESTVVRYPEKR